MKRLSLFVALLLGLATPALAAQKTITLSVPGMYCSVCPITVKKALSQVNGVSQVAVDYERKQASVVFDDSKAKVSDLTWATEEAGYPSKPISSVKGERK